MSSLMIQLLQLLQHKGHAPKHDKPANLQPVPFIAKVFVN